MAPNVDYDVISDMKEEELFDILVALITFASRDNYRSALLEWADERLAFQANYNLMERSAISRSISTHNMDRSEFYFFRYTNTSLRDHLLMVRESALRLAVRLLMVDDRFSLLNCQAILQNHPEVIDKLLDLALMPRSLSVPQCQLDSLSIFALSRLIRGPGPQGCALWIDGQLTKAVEMGSEEDRVAFYHCLQVFCERPGALDKLVGAYRKSITEFSTAYDHLISWVCLYYFEHLTHHYFPAASQLCSINKICHYPIRTGFSGVFGSLEVSKFQRHEASYAHESSRFLSIVLPADIDQPDL